MVSTARSVVSRQTHFLGVAAVLPAENGRGGVGEVGAEEEAEGHHATRRALPRAQWARHERQWDPKGPLWRRYFGGRIGHLGKQARGTDLAVRQRPWNSGPLSFATATSLLLNAHAAVGVATAPLLPRRRGFTTGARWLKPREP